MNSSYYDHARFCSRCGAELAHCANFCSRCGAQVYQNTYSSSNRFYNFQGFYQQPARDLSNAVRSMIFGAIAPELAIFSFIPFFGIFFLAATIVFIILAFKMRSDFISRYGFENGFTRAGKICATVAIPITSFFGFLGMIFNIALFFAPV
ncbi:MAG: zinc-ribbon domain-containing protein [Clostridia bacterium]|nr:zinc-ribbon domain-containing protein [Clostridia bacterium]